MGLYINFWFYYDTVNRNIFASEIATTRKFAEQNLLDIKFNISKSFLVFIVFFAIFTNEMDFQITILKVDDGVFLMEKFHFFISFMFFPYNEEKEEKNMENWKIEKENFQHFYSMQTSSYMSCFIFSSVTFRTITLMY